MSWQKGQKLYEGKAKILYQVVGDENLVWVDYKNDLTAFNAQKKGSFAGKGELNCQISTLIFKHLRAQGVESHWVETLSPSSMICKKVDIIPLEVVVRNRLAGSTAKKFFFTEGSPLKKPLVEFYYKKDEWNDPFVSDDQALMLGAVSDPKVLEDLKRLALKTNEVLLQVFTQADINLIDFKTEWGWVSGELQLADEISPDCARLWDKKTDEKLDKDRFRLDLGSVRENYERIWQRLKELEKNL